MIPRWLSGWGLLAIVSLIAVWLVALFTHSPMTAYTALLLPLIVQEMVLAIWLMVRGFAPPTPRPGRIPVSETIGGSRRARGAW